MKIIDNRGKKPTTFYDLCAGDTFEYEGEIWLKINYDEAFNLETEEIEGIGDNTIVHKVKITITIED